MVSDADFNAVKRRLTELERKLKTSASGLALAEDDIDALELAVVDLTTDLGTLTTDVGLLDTDLTALEAAVAAGTGVTVIAPFAPTLTNITLGTGGTPTNTAKGIFIGGPNSADAGWLGLNGFIQLGTTDEAMGTNPTIALPSGYTMGTLPNTTVVGRSLIVDADTAANSRWADLLWRSATTFAPILGGYTGALGGITSTAPHTWADNDNITWSLWVPVVRT